MYDVAVIGLGAMGSAALYHLAVSGARVVGFDRHDPPHTLGSTHGKSRIIREAYYERPVYVPLVQRAYQNWAALERASGTTLFRRTGGLMIGSEHSALVRGTLESAAEHSIPIERLSRSDIASRFPAIVPAQDMVGVLEQNAGLLVPEACVRAHLTEARTLGADIRGNEPVVRVERDGGSYLVHSVSGEIRARRIAAAAGPWMPELLAHFHASYPLEVERQTMHWFDSNGDRALLTPPALPVVMIELENERLFYATPDVGDGVKAAIHHEGVITTADGVDRSVTSDDTGPVERLVERFLPAVRGRVRESVVCLYTDTPDRDFIVDALDDGGVVVVSACSGHGFKFASALGEIAAQLAMDHSPVVDTSFFTAARFDVARAATL